MKITPSFENLENINCVGIVLKPLSPKLREFYFKAKALFEDVGIEVFIERTSAAMIGIDKADMQKSLRFDDLCAKSDFLVSIGGDGTLISVARRSFKYDKAVLGVNLGHLGFLTDIMPDELQDFIKKIKEGDYRIDNRMMIEATAGLNSFVAFNDIVITRKSISNMVYIDAKVDGKQFNSYHGDGLIVSTPTGSTAYNLSCGGPVVYPLTDAFIVTPISPHSLTQRPLVLPVDFEIELSTPDNKGAVVIIDGQDIYEIKQNESIKVKIASKKAKLIHRTQRNYFEVLSEKMRWGD